MKYINEKWPTSNSKPGVFYILKMEGMKRRHYYTVDDVQTAIQDAKHNGIRIEKAIRMADGMPSEFIPETRAEQSARENREHCKHIAENLEAYTAGNIYRCPECNEEIQLPDDVGDKYRCPHCETVSDIDDLEQLSIWDYLDDVFDIEYRIDSNKELRSVQLMVACGGPNIYIDTASKAVELYWWGERANYPISYDAATEIDAWAEELYKC